MLISSSPKDQNLKDRRFGCYVQEAERAHCVEPIPERVEGTTLREEHEQTIKALVQVRVIVGLEQLQSKICSIWFGDRTKGMVATYK